MEPGLVAVVGPGFGMFAVLVPHPEIVIAVPSTMAAVGFLAGVMGRRYPKAPWIAGAAMVLAYVVLLAVAGAWTAACPDCQESDSTRQNVLGAATIVGFAATWSLVTIVWMSFAAAVAVRGFLRWVRPQ